MKIISIHSGKGGVGKTTFAANLGGLLASQGSKTLLVDADFFTRDLSFLSSHDHWDFEIGYLELLNQLSRSYNASEEANLTGDEIETMDDRKFVVHGDFFEKKTLFVTTHYSSKQHRR